MQDPKVSWEKFVAMVNTHFCIKMNRLSYKSSNFVCMMLFMCIYAKYSVFLYQKMRCYGNHMFSLKYIEVESGWHHGPQVLNNFHIQAIMVKFIM